MPLTLPRPASRPPQAQRTNKPLPSMLETYYGGTLFSFVIFMNLYNRTIDRARRRALNQHSPAIQCSLPQRAPQRAASAAHGSGQDQRASPPRNGGGVVGTRVARGLGAEHTDWAAYETRIRCRHGAIDRGLWVVGLKYSRRPSGGHPPLPVRCT